eukprot:TRINITY_DN6547_c0_g2_i1.p1 TRINITY_DN6547_c0_g2~~TRINITY_DN6547_c0_g2_i1.p1  ORF type:complete len:374 (+),score=36.94 TRINITY_DN6547_c0_g2_i1:188-1309(+)
MQASMTRDREHIKAEIEFLQTHGEGVNSVDYKNLLSCRLIQREVIEYFESGRDLETETVVQQNVIILKFLYSYLLGVQSGNFDIMEVFLETVMMESGMLEPFVGPGGKVGVPSQVDDQTVCDNMMEVIRVCAAAVVSVYLYVNVQQKHGTFAPDHVAAMFLALSLNTFKNDQIVTQIDAEMQQCQNEIKAWAANQVARLEKINTTKIKEIEQKKILAQKDKKITELKENEEANRGEIARLEQDKKEILVEKNRLNEELLTLKSDAGISKEVAFDFLNTYIRYQQFFEEGQTLLKSLKNKEKDSQENTYKWLSALTKDSKETSSTYAKLVTHSDHTNFLMIAIRTKSSSLLSLLKEMTSPNGIYLNYLIQLNGY